MYRDPNEDETPASNNENSQDESILDRNAAHQNNGSAHNKNGNSQPDDKSAAFKKQCQDLQKKKNSDTYFGHLWQQARDGDQDALNELSKLIAPELQRIAQVLLSKERPDHTLTTNALINELYLRLLSNDLVTIHDRSHFLALAARRMRFILIDYARRRNNQRNNNGQRPGTFDENLYDHVETPGRNVDNILDIDKALTELEKIHPGWAKVVELRYFGGCQFNEVAEILDINQRRAERYWSRARTWLFNYLKGTQ